MCNARLAFLLAVSFAVSFLGVAACGTSSTAISDGAQHGAGGGAGMPAGLAGRTWTEGQFEGEEAEDAPPPVPHGNAVDCEKGPVPLLRPGCPLEVPWASDCADEGLHCLYPGESEGCFDEWECLLGLWSTLGGLCREDLGADPENDPACSGVVPVDGEPCTFADVQCRYGSCGDFGYRQASMTCECGRAVVEDLGCPTVP